MIKFIPNQQKDLFKIIDKRNFEDNKTYKLSEIAFLHFGFFDKNGDEPFITVYLKEDLKGFENEVEQLLNYDTPLPNDGASEILSIGFVGIVITKVFEAYEDVLVSL